MSVDGLGWTQKGYLFKSHSQTVPFKTDYHCGFCFSALYHYHVNNSFVLRFYGQSWLIRALSLDYSSVVTFTLDYRSGNNLPCDFLLCHGQRAVTDQLLGKILGVAKTCHVVLLNITIRELLRTAQSTFRSKEMLHSGCNLF